MTDYELVKDIQDNNSKESIEKLWNRYTPMAHKHGNALGRKFPKLYLKEDFVNDAFFQMMTAVQKVKWNKIDWTKSGYSKSTWKFVGVYWYFLKKLSYQYQQTIFETKNKIIVPTIENAEECECECEFDILFKTSYSSLLYNYSPEELLKKKELINKQQLFENSLNDQQRFILSERKDGKIMKDIANSLNTNNVYIHRQIKEMKQIASKVFSIDY